jgi:hypothetical protein
MFNVSKLVFCGVVACASVLGACMADESGDVAAQSEALVQEGAATDDVTIYTEEDVKSGKVAPDGDVGIQATVSFIRTCVGWSFIVRNSDGAVVFADADSCRRRNGTWTGYRSWSGVCRGDVSNQDGTIRC